MRQDDNDNIEVRARAERMLADPQSPDDPAKAHLMIGCIHEREADWDSAVGRYLRVLEADPEDPRVRYFGHNNLAYSLVQLGRFDEAEPHCLAAIRINPDQYNAHKNLGLVRQGQRRQLEAAFSFVAACRACPREPRAWHLLEALLSGHPEILAGSEDLQLQITRLELPY